MKVGDKMENGEKYKILGFINNLNYSLDNNIIKINSKEALALLKNIIEYLNNKINNTPEINNLGEQYRIKGFLQNLEVAINEKKIIANNNTAGILLKNLIFYLSELEKTYNTIKK